MCASADRASRTKTRPAAVSCTTRLLVASKQLKSIGFFKLTDPSAEARLADIQFACSSCKTQLFCQDSDCTQKTCFGIQEHGSPSRFRSLRHQEGALQFERQTRRAQYLRTPNQQTPSRKLRAPVIRILACLRQRLELASSESLQIATHWNSGVVDVYDVPLTIFPAINLGFSPL